jgi:F-type H+-transporting ATPase subunit b
MRGLPVGSWLVLLACVAVCVAVSPVRAEDKHEVITKYNVTIHHGKEEEEKKFDVSKEDHAQELTALLREGKVAELQQEKVPGILDISWDLALWTSVVFILLFVILNKVAWKPMQQGLHRREQNIREALEEAQKARTEAQQLREELQKEMDGVQEKVRGIMENARRDAQRATEEMVTNARADIQAERERLRREIDLARDQALQELWNQTAQLATLISAKAIRRQLNADDHRRLTDEAIAELRQASQKVQREVASV